MVKHTAHQSNERTSGSSRLGTRASSYRTRNPLGGGLAMRANRETPAGEQARRRVGANSNNPFRIFSV